MEAELVHAGDAGTQFITFTNTDPNDGYSENLIATVIGTTGWVTASGSTGDIAPLSTGMIALQFSTANILTKVDGKVTKVVFYFDCDRAFTDLGLARESDASTS